MKKIYQKFVNYCFYPCRGRDKIAIVKYLFLIFIFHFSLFAFHLLASDVECENYINNEIKENRYIDNQDGLIIDRKTNLMWKKCSEGQKYINNTCSDSIILLNWPQSKNRVSEVNSFDGLDNFSYKDWRLPSIKELLTIAVPICNAPSINTKIFPNTLSTLYWTIDSHKDRNVKKSYGISFYYGELALSEIQYKRAVRFVRTNIESEK